MPLESGSSEGAFKRNVSTLMGEIGKSPHVQSRAQALAIAYSKQRSGRAPGGYVELSDTERLPPYGPGAPPLVPGPWPPPMFPLPPREPRPPHRAGGGLGKLRAVARSPYSGAVENIQRDQMQQIYDAVRPRAPREIQDILEHSIGQRLRDSGLNEDFVPGTFSAGGYARGGLGEDRLGPDDAAVLIPIGTSREPPRPRTGLIQLAAEYHDPNDLTGRRRPPISDMPLGGAPGGQSKLPNPWLNEDIPIRMPLTEAEKAALWGRQPAGPARPAEAAPPPPPYYRPSPQYEAPSLAGPRVQPAPQPGVIDLEPVSPGVYGAPPSAARRPAPRKRTTIIPGTFGNPNSWPMYAGGGSIYYATGGLGRLGKASLGAPQMGAMGRLAGFGTGLISKGIGLGGFKHHQQGGLADDDEEPPGQTLNDDCVHLVQSEVPGRTDRIPMTARAGSYILPADVVSGLGQGNTAAGAKMWADVLKMHMPKGGKMKMPPLPGAAGGMAAGGV